jgi:hypothetical protein
LRATAKPIGRSGVRDLRGRQSRSLHRSRYRSSDGGDARSDLRPARSGCVRRT